MAYVEWHDSIRNHYKTDALMLELGIKRREAVGIVGCLSAWAIQYRPGGVIEKRLIKAAVEWDRSEDIADTLVKVGFLDVLDEETVSIHDWRHVTSGYVKARKDAKRKKLQRKMSTDSPRTVRGQSADAAEMSMDGRGEQNRTEQSGTSGAEAVAPAPILTVEAVKATKGGCDAGYLAALWPNGKAGAQAITHSKAAEQVKFALSRGAKPTDIEAAFMNLANCRGRKIWEVLDALCRKPPSSDEEEFRRRRDAAGPVKL